MPSYLGIDPGASGGFCLLEDGGVVRLTPMPKAIKGICNVFEHWYYASEALLEKVGGYLPKSEGNIGSAMFQFGRSYGRLETLLTEWAIPYEEVQPAEWQRAVGISPRRKSEKKHQYKRRIKEQAITLFPGVKGITLNTCDALLIALYCRMKHGKE